MKKQRKKRAVTLIEIMIVILLIGLIGGALAFNMRGSMDKGKQFKTEQNIARVYDALMLEYAKGELTIDEIIKEAPKIVKATSFIKEPERVLKDAWGKALCFEKLDNDDIKVFSKTVEDMEKNGAKK